MITSTALFAFGNSIAGGANGVAVMIAGRTVQGLGAGGITMLLDLRTCDLVSLRERGK
jgi:MFS family permease